MRSDTAEAPVFQGCHDLANGVPTVDVQVVRAISPAAFGVGEHLVCGDPPGLTRKRSGTNHGGVPGQGDASNGAGQLDPLVRAPPLGLRPCGFADGMLGSRAEELIGGRPLAGGVQVENDLAAARAPAAVLGCWVPSEQAASVSPAVTANAPVMIFPGMSLPLAP